MVSPKAARMFRSVIGVSPTLPACCWLFLAWRTRHASAQFGSDAVAYTAGNLHLTGMCVGGLVFWCLSEATKTTRRKQCI